MDGKRRRTHHRENGLKKEEYAAEFAPSRFHLRKQEAVRAYDSDRIDAGSIIGYVALFLSLFSIAFYPIVFGMLGVALGLLAVSYGARTLGFTAIGFGGFSLLFAILYPLILSLLY
jgi:hypothetical protein